MFNLFKSLSKKKNAELVKSAPMATGTVRTLTNPRPPAGYLWDKLNAAVTPRQIKLIKEEALRIGYSAEGNFIQECNRRLK